MGRRPNRDEDAEPAKTPVEREADADEDRGGGWLPGGYGGPIPVRPKERVTDITGKAPGGGAPAGNAARDRKG
jgi:hypothetical protein